MRRKSGVQKLANTLVRFIREGGEVGGTLQFSEEGGTWGVIYGQVRRGLKINGRRPVEKERGFVHRLYRDGLLGKGKAMRGSRNATGSHSSILRVRHKKKDGGRKRLSGGHPGPREKIEKDTQ